MLYLSRYIIERKEDYNRRLIDVTREEAWEPWLLYMLEAVRDTAVRTLGKIQAIRSLYDATRERVSTELPKIYSRELVDVIFEQPYCRIENVVNAGIAKRQTASLYLKALADLELLEPKRIGREAIYVNPELLTLLG